MAEFTVKLPRQIMGISHKSKNEVENDFKSVGDNVFMMPVCMGNDTLPQPYHMSNIKSEFIGELLTVSGEVSESYFEVHEGNVYDVLRIINRHDIRVIEEI